MRSPIIIHAGLPRTATTTLQQTLFPKYCNHPLYTKDRMSSMLTIHEDNILHKLNEGLKLTNAEIARTIFTASARTNNDNDYWFSILLKSTEKLLIKSESSELSPILSSELLTQTVASLRILESEAGRQFGIIPLIKAVNKFTNEPPKIILCLRDPIQHFCSLFLRIVRLGVIEKEDLNKYVKYQFMLENSWKYSSNIAHLFHKSLITYLEDQNSIVTPVRYKDLLETSDALRLLKLEGEKIALSDLKKENNNLTQPDLNLSQGQITHMQLSIRELFKELGIYNKINEEAYL